MPSPKRNDSGKHSHESSSSEPPIKRQCSLSSFSNPCNLEEDMSLDVPCDTNLILRPSVKTNIVSQPSSSDEHDCFHEEETSSSSFLHIDNNLEEKLKKHGLNRRNVKTIIHELLSDEHVRGLLKANLNEEESQTLNNELPEPKNLRSKSKKASDQATPVEKFTDIPLPEDDDDDEEYNPDVQENSQDTIFSSQDALGSSLDLDISECTSIRQSPQKMNEEDNCQFLNDLNQCENELKAIHEKSLLHEANIEKEIIACRTRSKHSLLDTALVEIETAFNPPDVEDDMYTPSGDYDWHKWLAELMLDDTALKYPDVNEDDHEQDPDYNFIQSDAEEKNEKEENRTDSTTRIPRKEVEELLQSCNDPPMKHAAAAPGVPSKQRSSHKGSFQRSIFIPKLPKNSKVRDHLNVLDVQKSVGVAPAPSSLLQPPSSSSIPSTPNDVSQTLNFSRHQTSMLKLQLRQYIQLLTQTNLLHRGTDGFSTIVHESHALLKELQQLSEHDKKTMKISESYFNVSHLSEAISIVEQPVPASEPIKRMTKSAQKKSCGSIPHNVGNIIATSPVFAFSNLLPTTLPDTDTVRINFTPAEDNLLVLGLAQMQGHQLPWQVLIHQYMMPCKQPDQIKTHVRNSSHRTDANNPIRLYKENGMLPSTPPLHPPDVGLNNQVKNLLHFCRDDLPGWLLTLQHEAGVLGSSAEVDVNEPISSTPKESAISNLTSEPRLLSACAPSTCQVVEQSASLSNSIAPITDLPVVLRDNQPVPVVAATSLPKLKPLMPNTYLSTTPTMIQRPPDTFTVVSPVKPMSIVIPAIISPSVMQPVYQSSTVSQVTTGLVRRDLFSSSSKITDRLFRNVRKTFSPVKPKIKPETTGKRKKGRPPKSKRGSRKLNSALLQSQLATHADDSTPMLYEATSPMNEQRLESHAKDHHLTVNTCSRPKADGAVGIDLLITTSPAQTSRSHGDSSLMDGVPLSLLHVQQLPHKSHRAQPVEKQIDKSNDTDTITDRSKLHDVRSSNYSQLMSSQKETDKVISDNPSDSIVANESVLESRDRHSSSPSSENNHADIVSPAQTYYRSDDAVEIIANPTNDHELSNKVAEENVQDLDIDDEDDLEDDVVLTEDDFDEGIDLNEIGDDLSEEDLGDDGKTWERKRKKIDLKVKWRKRNKPDTKKLGGRLHRLHPGLIGKRKSKSGDDNLSEILRQSAEKVKMLEEETIVQLDPARGKKEMIFAQGYLKRMGDALADHQDVLIKVLEIMCEFDMDNSQSPPTLFRKLSKLLHPWPDLIQGFAPFLMPEQAHQCGLLSEQQVYAKARKFLRQLEIRYHDNPQHLTKILSAFTMVAETGIYNQQEMKTTILSLLKSDLYLQEEFLIFFDDEHPPESRLHGDYEDVMWNCDLLKDSHSNHFENVHIPSLGNQTSSTNTTEGQTERLPTSPARHALDKSHNELHGVNLDTEDEDGAGDEQKRGAPPAWDDAQGSDTEEELVKENAGSVKVSAIECPPDIGLISEDAQSCSPFKRHVPTTDDRPETPTTASTASRGECLSLPSVLVESDRSSSQGSALPLTPTGSRSLDHSSVLQQVNRHDCRVFKPWTRDEDAQLLSACKERGPTTQVFASVAKSSGRSATETQQRFQTLMALLSHTELTDTDTASHYSDSGSDTEL